jgi:hypothetical protein
MSAVLHKPKPSNCKLYADLAEYCPFDERSHVIRSSCSCMSTTFSSLSQRSRNSAMICWFMLWSMSLIHLCSVKASATERFLRLLCLKSSGNKSAGASPLSQLEFQKDALRPFPSSTLVAELKRRRSSLSTGISRPLHGRSLSSHSNHSHRNRRDLLKLSRSLMPRPPFGVGVQTLVHATLHLPPVSWPSPAQRNQRRSLLNSLRNFFGGLITVTRYIGSELSTDLTNSLLPTTVIIFPCQPAILDFARS